MNHETDMQGNHVLTFAPREFEELLVEINATAAVVLEDLADLIRLAKRKSFVDGQIKEAGVDIRDFDSWGDSWEN